MQDLQYCCDDDGRRLAGVRADPALNGIELLAVLDQEAPPGIARQQSLLVRCAKEVPLTLGRDNVRIEGGRRADPRVNPVRVVWAMRASAVATVANRASPTPADVAYFPTVEHADRVLVVRTTLAGDFSTYRVRLVRSPSDDRPPDGFDPVLSSVQFTFKVDCPTDFDCASTDACAPESWPEPLIDYLAKDYESFRRLLLDRLALTMPGWTERNTADVGVTVVELLAYVADHLSYYQDAVATEAYLGTARRRTSVRRHARLLDYAMHDGCSARAWLTIEVAKAGGADGLVLPAGTAVLTADVGVAAVGFETLHDLRLSSARNELELYTWGRLDCCLPKGATRATLRIAPGAADPKLVAGDILVFEEVLGPSGVPAEADLAHRHAVRLDAAPVADTDPLGGAKVLQIRWHHADALPFPLCLRQFGDATGTVRSTSVARANVVLAEHGLTAATEDLPAVVAEARSYHPRLTREDLAFAMPYDHDEARRSAAAVVTRADPRLALPQVGLDAGGERWLPRRDLVASDRFATEFVVETEEDGRATLRFGNGVVGRRPVTGTVFTAHYRVGTGAAGNVGPESLTRLATAVAGVTRVRNPLPATGGADPEPIEDVRQYAPQAFRRQERAVTDADYAAVAERHPEVQRATARRRWTGSWFTEFVSVDRRAGYGVDRTFEAELAMFLDRYRMAGRDVEVDGPVFVPLDIALTVCVAPGYLRGDVKRALLDLFSNRDLPGGRRGVFHPDNFTFGQPVYLSAVVAAAMGVPGVAWVDTNDGPGWPNRFRRWGQPAAGERDAGLIPMARLEVARLDNDPDTPENGRIEFLMGGGRA